MNRARNNGRRLWFVLLVFMRYSFETGGDMDLKKKRTIVIITVLAIAILIHFMVSIFGLKVKIPGDLTNIIFGIYVPNFYVTAFVKKFSESHILLYSTSIITYLTTYFVIGWIVARLIYRTPKDFPELPEKGEPQK